MGVTPVLAAYPGDSWLSPKWAVVLDDAAVSLTDWQISAEVRRNPATTTTLWTWAPDSANLLTSTAQITTSAGTQLTTGTIQLALTPADWIGKPAVWSGQLTLTLASDATSSPVQRFTVIRQRPFKIGATGPGAIGVEVVELVGPPAGSNSNATLQLVPTAREVRAPREGGRLVSRRRDNRGSPT